MGRNDRTGPRSGTGNSHSGADGSPSRRSSRSAGGGADDTNLPKISAATDFCPLKVTNRVCEPVGERYNEVGNDRCHRCATPPPIAPYYPMPTVDDHWIDSAPSLDQDQAVEVAAGGELASSRRGFFKGSGLLLAGGALGGPLVKPAAVHAFGPATIRIGLVGCGARGVAAVMQALGTSGGDVRLAAMADVFPHQLQAAYRAINGKYSDRVEVTADTRLVGLHAYRDLMQTDVDVVYLATPPAFRPAQFEAAVLAGKHVFMEKPVAVDAPGVRRVLAAGQIATQKGLAVQVGLQRRHELRYQECIKRLHDGAIGRPIFARAYWNGTGSQGRQRRPQQSELEFQISNWGQFTWLSGDQITEQHVLNLDVINWAMQGYPVDAQGQGGRQGSHPTGAGQIFDHHMVEYSYASGARLLSQCRQMAGCWSKVGEHLHGTLGSCDLTHQRITDLDGKLVWQCRTQEAAGKGWQQEQADLFAAIRAGQRPNETEYAAYSTLTAIMGRMASYSGKLVTWQQALNNPHSLADVDALTDLDGPAPVQPTEAGQYPAATPGSSAAV